MSIPRYTLTDTLIVECSRVFLNLSVRVLLQLAGLSAKLSVLSKVKVASCSLAPQQGEILV